MNEKKNICNIEVMCRHKSKLFLISYFMKCKKLNNLIEFVCKGLWRNVANADGILNCYHKMALKNKRIKVPQPI